jgi:hypothetical protein
MSTFKLVLGGVALFGLIALGALYPVRALAVDLGVQPQIKADIVAKTGDSVRLFHGGTEEAKKVFCKDEVVPIYRYYGRYMQTKQVGKVKIGDFVGEHYVDGKVVEGEVGPGDVAMKGSAACLVVKMQEEK